MDFQKAANNAAVVCAMHVADAIKPADTLEQRVKAAFAASKDFWMSTDNDVRFRGSLAAVMDTASDEERISIVTSIEQLQLLSAMLKGIPIDLTKIKEPGTVLPLLGWYREATKEPG